MCPRPQLALASGRVFPGQGKAPWLLAMAEQAPALPWASGLWHLHIPCAPTRCPQPCDVPSVYVAVWIITALSCCRLDPSGRECLTLESSPFLRVSTLGDPGLQQAEDLGDLELHRDPLPTELPPCPLPSPKTPQTLT